MKWASQMTGAEIVAELIVLDKKIDEHEAAPLDDKAHGGSPGEGMYERHEELTRELGRR